MHDIDTLFAYSKIICNRDSLRYKLILHRKCEPDDAFYILKGLCFFNLKKYSEAITQFDKYFNKANTKLKENNEEDIENMSKAYYFRGLSKIALKNKQSGCDDLSKSGELGYSQAYEAIQDKCN